MQIHIAFGANLGDREENIHQAVQLMSQQVGPLIRCSSLIETAPVDMLSDNAFLNAVAIFDTKLAPGRILQIAKRIERQLGREHKSDGGEHFDRPIDIDLLQYGSHHIHNRDLTLPHPRLAERDFVLRPLVGIDPDGVYVGEGGGTFRQLLDKLTPDYHLTFLEEPTQADLEGINHLLPQLTPGRKLDWTSLERIVQQPNIHLILMRANRSGEMLVVGMATVCMMFAPSGTKAYVEDVVVDELHRGKGLGRRLIRAAKDLAAEQRAITLHLTSRPERVEANALYISEGFERRETNVYCIRL